MKNVNFFGPSKTAKLISLDKEWKWYLLKGQITFYYEHMNGMSLLLVVLQMLYNGLVGILSWASFSHGLSVTIK